MEQVTKIQEKLIDKLYNMGIEKDDALGILLLAKKFKKNSKLYEWLRKNPKADAESIFGFLFKLCF